MPPATKASPAPRLPSAPGFLVEQMPVQLGLVAGLTTDPPPLFPLALSHGAYASNSFNLIFRARSNRTASVEDFEKQLA